VPQITLFGFGPDGGVATCVPPAFKFVLIFIDSPFLVEQ
jgi:hypothetical protein